MTRSGECYIGDDDGSLSMVALFDTQKAVERLRGGGVAEDQAAATVEMVTEAVSQVVTTERLDAAVEKLRAELWRALLFAVLVIIGTMTAIIAAFTQLV